MTGFVRLMADTFNYDVFLSYGAKDKLIVRQLAERLRSDGLRVWFAEWEFIPFQRAATKQHETEEGLQQSRALVLCMSGNIMAAEWEAIERQTTIFRDPAYSQRRFIPLRLDDAEIKEIFAAFEWLDWRAQSTEQYAHLLSACQAVDPRSQPDIVATKIDSEKTFSLVDAGHIWSMAFSRDGRLALSASDDRTVRVWEVESGRCLHVLKGHTNTVYGVALSGDGRLALSGSGDETVRVWDVAGGRYLRVLKGHTNTVYGVALSGDGRLALSGSYDRTARVWDVASGRCLRVLEGHTSLIWSAALSGDGRLALSGSYDKTARVWEVVSGRCLHVLKGHTNTVYGVALSGDGRLALSGSGDNMVRVWEVAGGRCLRVLEGHTSTVYSVALSGNGRLALSGSDDNTVRVWEVASGRCLRVLEGHTDPVMSVAFASDDRYAFSSGYMGEVRLWSLREIEAAAASAPSWDARYTNAKVVLVGESGVGKTGLALRLCEDRWEATESTHGMIISQLKFGTDTNSSDIEREVWLWDFAGQPDYRLIHQLYMDETALGVLVFDPQDDNPFDAVGHWERALHTATRARGMTPAKLLVAARSDRGGITISKKRFEDYCREHGFAGFLITGAKTGDGCDDLKAAIAAHIPWNQLPWITTTRLFKLLKDALLKLKEEDMPLARLPELRQRLQLMLTDETINADSLRTVVGLMEGQGVVKKLDFGDFILLQPEQINRYASVVVRMAREHVDEMGVVPEEQVLNGRLDYKDMARLTEADEKILLRAMAQTFLDRALCLRELTPQGMMQVFPSYFRRDKPEIKEYPTVFVTYGFAGPLDEIYTTLVVKLSYSDVFKKDQLWKDAADFKTPAGKRVGLAMHKKPEGVAELVVYFEAGVPDDTKVMFIKYVHEHLLMRAQDVTRVRAYTCPHCDTPLENRKAIEIRLKKGLKDIVCSACEERVVLIDLIEEKFASDEFARRVREMDEKARINLDNESRELILVGHAYAIAGEAGQIYRQYTNSDHGLDGEIEFKVYEDKPSDKKGKASNVESKATGMRLYLQLKSGDSYLYKRKSDGAEIFTIKKERWAEYWQRQAYPVMLVIRTSDGKIRWMNVTDYLKEHSADGKQVKQVVFDGEPFTAPNLQKLRDRLSPPRR
jgi:RNase P subunit RPR2